MRDYVPGDLVKFVKPGYLADPDEMGLVVRADVGHYIDTVYWVYWFKSRLVTANLASFLELVYNRWYVDGNLAMDMRPRARAYVLPPSPRAGKRRRCYYSSAFSWIDGYRQPR